MPTLTVNFHDFNGKAVIELVDYNPKTWRAFDVIQVIYQRNYKPKPSPGGTTIWKMGKVVVGDIDEGTTLEANAVIGNDTTFLREINI
jgi:hypothetical protein